MRGAFSARVCVQHHGSDHASTWRSAEGASTAEPAANRMGMSTVWFSLAAKCSTDSPALSRTVTSLPWVSSSCTMASLPSHTALQPTRPHVQYPHA
jgi:hypothetical protein